MFRHLVLGVCVTAFPTLVQAQLKATRVVIVRGVPLGSTVDTAAASGETQGAYSLDPADVGQTECEIKLEECQKELAAVIRERDQLKARQQRDELKLQLAADSHAIVYLEGAAAELEIPELFPITDGQVKIISTDGVVQWNPFQFTASEISGASGAGDAGGSVEIDVPVSSFDPGTPPPAPGGDGGEGDGDGDGGTSPFLGAAAPTDNNVAGTVAADSQPPEGDAAAGAEANQPQRPADKGSAGNQPAIAPAQVTAQAPNQPMIRVRIFPGTQAPADLHPAAVGTACVPAKPASRVFCLGEQESRKVSYRQPFPRWTMLYVVEEHPDARDNKIKAFVRLYNFTAYDWDQGTRIELADPTASSDTIELTLPDGIQLQPDQTGIFPVDSLSVNVKEIQYRVDLDASPLRTSRVAKIDAGDSPPNYFPAGEATFLTMDAMAEPTKIRTGTVGPNDKAAVSLGVDLGIRVSQKAPKESFTELHSLDYGVLDVIKKRESTVTVRFDPDRKHVTVNLTRVYDAANWNPQSGTSDGERIVLPVVLASDELVEKAKITELSTDANHEKIDLVTLGTEAGADARGKLEKLLESELSLTCPDDQVPEPGTDLGSTVLTVVCGYKLIEKQDKRRQTLETRGADVQQKLYAYEHDTKSPDADDNSLTRQSLVDAIGRIGTELKEVQRKIKLATYQVDQVLYRSIPQAPLPPPKNAARSSSAQVAAAR